MSLIRLFNLLVKKNIKVAILVIVISIATIMSSVGLLSLSAFIISYCALHPSIADIMVPVVGVRFLGLSRGVFRYLERLISHDTTFKLLSKLRAWLYGKVEAADMDVYMQMDKEDIFTRIINDIETLQEFYLRTFNPFMVSIIIGLLGCILLSFFGKIVALGFFLSYIFTIIFVPLLIWSCTKGMNKEIILKLSKIKVKLLDLISGTADIFANSAMLRYKENLDSQLKNLYALQTKLAIWQSISNNSIFFLSNVTMVICLITSAIIIRQNNLNGVTLAIVALSTIALFEAASQIPLMFQRLEQTKASADRIFNMADNCTRKADGNNESTEISLVGKCIELDKVDFKYPGSDKILLKDISFKLSKGKKIAIVGSSGVGKSTLSFIMLNWLKTQMGSVKIDGHSLTSLKQEKIEEQFSVVNQQIYFFNASIKNNLLIANSSSTQEEIEKVVEICGMKEFIKSLPEGYETEMGENGMKISGGQRQRLGIARAMLKNSSFLIMDEITAGMDMLLEKKFLESLYKNIRDKGILMITHRLIAMEKMDEILVLDKGFIVERGTHKELINKNGLYFKMYELQRQYLSR
ncbi:MAG: thiol reductant ABC exporter subunit CydC [Clostridiaceae bacterium]|nr:thiol reductant ABC exporter subunit CydC [Clostridiaceae bacterium]